jgi:hypothetical protein
LSPHIGCCLFDGLLSKPNFIQASKAGSNGLELVCPAKLVALRFFRHPPPFKFIHHGAPEMHSADFSTPGLQRSAADFVRSDSASLASHMRLCDSSRGRLFAVKTGLQSAHATLASRVITVAACVFVSVALIAFV